MAQQKHTRNADMNKVSVVRRLQDNSVTTRKNRTHAPEQITSDLRRETEEVRHVQPRSTSRCFNLWIRFGSMTRYIFAPRKKDLTSRRPKRATDVVQQAQRRRCRLSQSWPRQSARIEVLRHRSFYARQLLHTAAFAQRSFFTRNLFTRKSFYTQMPLCKEFILQREAFTQSSFYT